MVLDSECRWQWLDPELSDREVVRKVARRLDPERLIAYPVSTRVNRPANDDPGLLEPIDDYTADTRSLGRRQFLEVCPHPALLSLLQRAKRVPYKVSKSKKYWVAESVAGRIRNLLGEFTTIRGALCEIFDGLMLELPKPEAVKRSLAVEAVRGCPGCSGVRVGGRRVPCRAHGASRR